MNKSSFIQHPLTYTAALIISCFFVPGCENSERTIHELSDNKQLQEEARDVESFLSQDGKMKARLKAPLMIRVAFSGAVSLNSPLASALVPLLSPLIRIVAAGMGFPDGSVILPVTSLVCAISPEEMSNSKPTTRP